MVSALVRRCSVTSLTVNSLRPAAKGERQEDLIGGMGVDGRMFDGFEGQ